MPLTDVVIDGQVYRRYADGTLRNLEQVKAYNSRNNPRNNHRRIYGLDPATGKRQYLGMRPADKVVVEHKPIIKPEDLVTVEGGTETVIVTRVKRDRAFVKKVKAYHWQEHDMLACAKCGFDPVATWGISQDEAEYFMEVDHIIPFSKDNGERTTTLETVQLLCRNCHGNKTVVDRRDESSH